MEKLHLTESQQAAADRIKFFWEIKRSRTNSLGGISTRPIPLLVGPSGAGKTACVRDFAAKEGIAMFSVSVTSWIVRGASVETGHSCKGLAEFVDNNPCGIIFLDELNKLRASHLDCSWTMHVVNEIMAVLDMDERLLNMGFRHDQLEKIKSQFLLVGAGAWQEVWVGCKPRATMGFAGQSDGSGTVDHQEFITAVREQGVIPEEMLFRFNEHLLLISPPTVDEVAARISVIRDAAMMDPLGANELGALAADAVASNRSMRWLEAYTLEILAIVPKEVWQGNPAALPQTMLSDASSQTQPATPVRNAPESQRYARMYASSYAIIQRLSYDISLAATEVSNRIRSEGLHVNSTTVRCQFLEGLASIAYKFTQPNLSAGLRLAYFEMLKENIEGISERFNSFSQRIIMERVEAATREAFHHLQQLAFQFRMESDLLTQILKRPEELVQNRIVDHADPRVEWFIK